MPAAGSVATYAARGLHPAVGFLVAWGYVLVGFLIPPLVLLQLGFTTAATLNAEFHGYPADLWWPWALLGALIVLTTYAVDVAYGPTQFHNFTTGTGAASWEGMARSLYGIFWFFVFLAIVNSTIANANAGVNVSTRTAYAMGRIGAFPHFLARVHPKHRSPVPAILTAFLITVAVT